MKPYRICHLSAGVASWMAAKRTVERYGPEMVLLLFADTLIESAGAYAFLEACVANIGTVYGFHRLSDGRTPWQVFRDERFLGNSRVDPCSRILKRELLAKWIEDRFTPENCVQVFGFDWSEGDRFERLQKRFDPWPVDAPLLEPPYLEKRQIVQKARDAGLPISPMYELGFDHDNCGGRCVKAGQAHYAKLFHVLPSVYAEVESEENALRGLLGNVSILKDRTGGESRPLPLGEFRARIEAKNFDTFDFGACSCFAPVEATA